MMGRSGCGVDIDRVGAGAAHWQLETSCFAVSPSAKHAAPLHGIVRMKSRPVRKSIRLREWDYAHAGAYFVTINAAKFQCLFGEVLNGTMQLNPRGQIAESEWLRTVDLRSNVELDAYVIMPNHMHGIVMLFDLGQEIVHSKSDVVGAQRAAPLRKN